MASDRKKALLGAALTGMLAAAGGASANQPDGMKPREGAVECSGVNACKGQGECGGKNHGCAGQNECKGKGWISLSPKECEAKGGTYPGMPAKKKS